MMTLILKVEDLKKYFQAEKTGIWSSGEKQVFALDGISLELKKGEILALAGESGCGKSTLALTLMNLEKPTSGRIIFEGMDITNIPRRYPETDAAKSTNGFPGSL